MKRPPHKKNAPVPATNETPSVDERHLVGADESFHPSIEDRMVFYWKENKVFVIGCLLCLLASIIVINGFRLYGKFEESSLQAAYNEAKATDTLDAFAKARSDTPLGGFAALTLADDAFETEAYPEAIESYGIAIQALDGNPLAGRAALGQAFARYRSGAKEQGLADLGGIAANGRFSQSIRAEAVYHLAVDAFVAGRTEVFQSYAGQIEGFEQAPQWNQRLQYYLRQNPVRKEKEAEENDEAPAAERG